jgi:hypothetical protein
MMIVRGYSKLRESKRDKRFSVAAGISFLRHFETKWYAVSASHPEGTALFLHTRMPSRPKYESGHRILFRYQRFKMFHAPYILS